MFFAFTLTLLGTATTTELCRFIFIRNITIKEDGIRLGNIGNFPHTKVLIELTRVIKHVTHVGNLGHVPFSDWLVEFTRIRKHAFHVGNIGHVPSTYVIIESRLACEQFTHIRHAGHIPIADMPVLFFSGITIRAPEIYCYPDIIIRSRHLLTTRQFS